MTSNAVPSSVTPPSPNEWPQDLVKTISNITRDSQARVTVFGHDLDADSNGTTFVGFKQVQGMIQINGMGALIQEVLDEDNFTVDIDSTNFSDYQGAGVIIVLTGLPPVEQAGFQFFNRPFQNVANQL